MNVSEHSAASSTLTEASMPTGDALVGAYAMLKSQFETQQDTLEKKDKVISAKDARIAVLEELLQLNKAERFAASSKSNPLQSNFFNEPEMWADTEPDEVEDNKASKDKEAQNSGKPKSAKPKHPSCARTFFTQR